MFEQNGKFYDEGAVQKYHNAVMKVKQGYVIKNHSFRHSKATNMTIKNISDFVSKAKGSLGFIKTEGVRDLCLFGGQVNCIIFWF